MQPLEYCRQKVALRGSSFRCSISFLQADKRDALTILFAYCREISEIDDECRDLTVARAKLQWWRQEVGRLFGGNARHPVARALHTIVQSYALTAEQLLAVIDATDVDLEISRCHTAAELLAYCHRAGALYDALLARALGYDHGTTSDYACELGAAFRLTQIIRDVGKDARRGRNYLPIEDLQRFEVPAANIENRVDHPHIAALIEFQINRTQSLYDQALQKLAEQDRIRQLPGVVMAALYQATLQEIERDGCRVLTHRIALPRWRKRWIAWNTRRRET